MYEVAGAHRDVKEELKKKKKKKVIAVCGGGGRGGSAGFNERNVLPRVTVNPGSARTITLWSRDAIIVETACDRLAGLLQANGSFRVPDPAMPRRLVRVRLIFATRDRLGV